MATMAGPWEDGEPAAKYRWKTQQSLEKPKPGREEKRD
jgi:hypothetical protein